MDLFDQIIRGTVLLVISIAIHVAALASFAPWLDRLTKRIAFLPDSIVFGAVLATSLLAIVLSHTIQVWLWAIRFMALGAFDDLYQAIYFAMVTYTTLGYGDITLGDDLSLFASFSAVTGLLAFGMSTAFLVAVFSRFIPDEDKD
ncbi:MAG: ion channel [Pseudomonadota bacterium]